MNPLLFPLIIILKVAILLPARKNSNEPGRIIDAFATPNSMSQSYYQLGKIQIGSHLMKNPQWIRRVAILLPARKNSNYNAEEWLAKLTATSRNPTTS